MKIRKAMDKDIPMFLELLTQVNMVHHNGRPDLFKGPAQKYTEDELKELFRNPGAAVFSAVDNDDNVLGYAICFQEITEEGNLRTGIRTLYLDDLCVDEAARRQHVGGQLYKHVVSYARENGYYNVTLHVWECNPSAEQFYRHQGMQVQYTCMEEIV
ncbi:MAG: GNAT family N-acetyltransferase [Lachnospiraceae bacterium]|nr:GNAT family N-acetyltransferase [Lachnospiraceae bacterium]